MLKLKDKLSDKVCGIAEPPNNLEGGGVYVHFVGATSLVSLT